MRLHLFTAALLACALGACSGDKGDAGSTGSTGDKGQPGATGAPGDNGTNGDKGANGTTGAMGTTGAQGDTGAKGTTGATGAKGPAGAMGDPGDDGAKGDPGDDGAKGDPGDDGTNGNNIIISDRAKHGLDISPVAVDTTGMTSAQIEAVGQGSYLINALADCGGCHVEAGSSPGFLGGTTASGNFNARNLTPDATTGMKLTEAQFLDVMRTGADYTCTTSGCTATGFTISGMAWPDFRWASTSDLKAMYAYLKVIPAVSNAVHADAGTHATATAAFPTTFVDGANANPLPAELDASNNPIPDPDFARRGMAIQPLDQVTSTDAAVEKRIGRGSYLVNSMGRCNGCHTNPARTSASPTAPINVAAYMTGGKVFSLNSATLGVVRSMSTDLVGDTNGFFGEPTADFVTFEGILQTGSHIDDDDPMPLAAPMPWQHLKDLTAEDLESIYTYLSAVQADQPAQLTADKKTSAASYYCTGNADCDAGAGETCDLTANSPTINECIGRTNCTDNADCPACQICDGGTHVCGGIDATCKASGI